MVSQHITIVGPGALGCLLASCFAQADKSIQVNLLDRNRDRAELIDKRGVIYQADSSEKTLPISASVDPQIISTSDIVFLCVKSYDIEETLREYIPYLQTKTLLIFMQNGIGHLEVAQSNLPATALLGTTTEGATLIGPGHVKHAGKGHSFIGFPQSCTPSQRVVAENLITNMQLSGVEASLSDKIHFHLWRKLFINTGINALTVLFDCLNGELLRIPKALNLMSDATEEALHVARHLQIDVESPLETTRDVCHSTANNVSSMLQDIRHGKKTEIEAINGAIVRLGKKYNIPTPVNAYLVKEIRKRENKYARE